MNIARESLTRAIAGNPKLETIRAIASALGVEAWELLTDSPVAGTGGDVHGVIYIGGKPNLVNSIKDIEALLQLSKIGQS